MRFDTEVTSGVGLVGMEFAGPADFGPITPIGPEDEAVLAGFAERLRARGKIDRFGVRLIRNQLGISDEQELMETCNKPRRALHCAVIETADRPAENSVERRADQARGRWIRAHRDDMVRRSSLLPLVLPLLTFPARTFLTTRKLAKFSSGKERSAPGLCAKSN